MIEMTCIQNARLTDKERKADMAKASARRKAGIASLAKAIDAIASEVRVFDLF